MHKSYLLKVSTVFWLVGVEGGTFGVEGGTFGVEGGTFGIDSETFGVDGGVFGVDSAASVDCSGKSIKTVS